MELTFKPANAVEVDNRDIDRLTKLAFANNVSANYNLGVIYYNGINVEKDYQKAFSYFEVAANSGHAKACNNLAIMYANGFGTNKDYKKAYTYYFLATEKGQIPSAYSAVAYMLENGIGVNTDKHKADVYYDLALTRNDKFAKDRASINNSANKPIESFGTESFESLKSNSANDNSSPSDAFVIPDAFK